MDSMESVTPRGPLFGLVVWIIARAMRVVPPSRRAAIAFRASRVLLPMARRLPNLQDTRRMNVEREADTAFGLALRLMDRCDVEFDLRFDVEGEELLDAALRSGAGTLLVGTHARTTQLIIRALEAKGVSLRIVSGDPRFRIPGTPRWLETIPTNLHMLVQALFALRNREVVWALLDRGAPHEGRTTQVETAMGDVHVADALLRIAVEAGARTLFMVSSMNDDGSVHVRYVAPRAGPNATAVELLEDFSRLIVEHNAAIASLS